MVEQGALPAAPARSVYAPPLQTITACDTSRSTAARLLATIASQTRPAREAALCDFLGRLAPRYEGALLLFDLAQIEAMLHELAAIQSRRGCRFLAPVKSFPHPVFLELVARHLSGFDVSNPAEYRSLPADLSGKMVTLTAPALRTDDLPSFVERGNDLVVFADSLYQVAQLESVASPLRYGVRLDSARLLEDLPADAPSRLHHSRFGLSQEDLLALLPMLERSRHRFAGFHAHHGSERNDAETYTSMIDAIVTLARTAKVDVGLVSLGGGQHHLDAPALDALVEDVRRRLGPDSDLYFEPGRLLTRGAGYAVGRVESWRRKGGAVEYVLDLSKDCHLRWSKPRLVVPTPSALERPLRVRFHGPTCHEEDFLGEFIVWAAEGERPPFEPGDLVLFANVSGYSASIRASFNGVGPAPVHFLPARA